MPIAFAALFIVEPLVFLAAGFIWAHYSLRAKRDHKPYLAALRGIAALASFATSIFTTSIEFQILTM